MRLIFAWLLVMGVILVPVGSVYASSSLAVIPKVTVLTTETQVYGLYEMQVVLDGDVGNPYNPDDVLVQAVFTGPGGQTFVVDGFWYVPYYRATTGSGVAVALREPGAFRIRFAPDEPGEWYYTVTATVGGRVLPSTESGVFDVAPSDESGFVRVGNHSRPGFQLDDGTPFYGIGVNLAWWDKNPGDYDRWIPVLAENGVNLIRIWMSPWSFGIEWNDDKLGRYDVRQEHAVQLDHVLQLAQAHGVRVLLVLVNHGQLSENVDARWADNPYNEANGGFLTDPAGFFTDEGAHRLFQQRLRYIIARWGHHTSILAWELFNEVNLTTGYDATAVTEWHRQMSGFIRELDPYNHLISTSFSSPGLEPDVWRLPNIDFTMTHFYDVSDMATAIQAHNKMKYVAYTKPTFAAEFGVTFDKTKVDPHGVFLHNGLWGSLFSPGAATGMSWWWNNYIEPRNLFHHFQSLSRFLSHTVGGARLAYVADVTVSDSQKGNVLISSTDGWGARPDDVNVVVNEDGSVAGPMQVASYLMGTAHNTQLRTDPMRFHLPENTPERITVLVDGVSASGATLKVAADGAVILTAEIGPSSPVSSSTTGVAIPPGTRLIEVENSGADWLRLTGYTFEGAGGKTRAFGVHGDGDIVVWLQDRDHTYAGIAAGYTPVVIDDAVLTVRDVTPGTYDVLWWDTWEGVALATETVYTGDDVTLNVPPFERDIAVRLRWKQPGRVF